MNRRSFRIFLSLLVSLLFMSAAYAGGDPSQSSSDEMTQPVMRTNFNTVIYPPIFVKAYPDEDGQEAEVDEKHFRPDGPDVTLHTHTPNIFGSGVAPAASDGPYSFVNPVSGRSAEDAS